MKLRIIHFFAAALLLLCVLPAQALIVLGGDEGHTNAPPDDPGWDTVGYVRSNWGSWNQSRASGVYIGDGWVLTAYHVLWFDAPTGIVFNAEPNKAYPVDVTSYVRLETNSFARLAASTNWIDPRTTASDESGRTEWTASANLTAPDGADLAMFRLKDGHYPDIEPARITRISSSQLSNNYLPYNNKVTAIATGRPRMEDLSYWTTNLIETTSNATDVAYSGYYDWPDTTYQPICRWGENWINQGTQIYDFGAPFGVTACLRTTFITNNANVFQMARLDSGGGVFYNGSSQWELLGLLTAKQLPDGTVGTIGLTNHPFGSHSLICDLSYYREQIMAAAEWPDLSVTLSADAGTWIGTGQSVTISVVTTNNTTNAVSQAFTNTLQIVGNDQTNSIFFPISSLNGGSSTTNTYVFTNNAPGTWTLTAATDSDDQVAEINEVNNESSKTFFAGPDLRITHLSPALTNTVAGSQISLQIVSTNQGIDDVFDSFEISYYLTTNDIFIPLSESELGAIEAGPKITANGLASGAAMTNAFEINAPPEIGRYYLRARIDSAASIAEGVEGNNWGPRCEIRVGPDLIITDVSPRTISAAEGASVDVDITIQNQGAVDISAAFLTELYVVDLQTGEGIEIPQWETTTTGLVAGASITYSTAFTAPDSAGTYYLITQLDDLHAVDEAIESNNIGILGQLSWYGGDWWPKSSILNVEDMYTVVTNNGAITITDYHGSGGDVEIPIKINGLPVTQIGNGAFAYSTNLTGITMPDTITIIEDQAFRSCTALTNAILSTNLTNLGYTPPGAGVFRDCSSLTHITIPASVTSVGSWAFGPCTSLKSVKLENNVIGYGMFAGCINLTDVTVPDSISTFGNQAFDGCTGLTTVHFLGDAPVAGGTDIFNNVPNATVYRSADTAGWGATWGGHPVETFPYRFTITNETITITGYDGPGGNVIIPSIIADLPVINISANAFSSCTNIVSITIPATVTSIEDQAFAGCIYLADLYFKGPAPTIGSNVFNNVPGIIHYLPGAAGWPAASESWNGLPTAVWNPVIKISSGLTSPFGFEFTWGSGLVVVIETSTNLAADTWVPMETNTLDDSPILFSDPESTNHPARFYRLRPVL